MKKIILRIFSAFVFSFLFTACYDAVFQGIRDEVELESGKISGFISNIARYTSESGTNYLFVTNGNIYYKNVADEQHGAWKKLSGGGLPGPVKYSYWDAEFSGVHFYKIIADENYVYALGYKPKYYEDNGRNVPHYIYLYYAKVTETEPGTLSFEWQKHESLSEKIEEYLKDTDAIDDDNYRMASSVHLFGTNSYTKAHRKAYIRIGGGLPYLENKRNNTWECYELSNGTETLVRSATYNSGSFTFTSNDGTYNEICRYTLSAVYFDGAVHFFEYLNADTNEGTVAAPTEPTYVYFGDDGEYLNSFAVADYKTGDGTNPIDIDVYPNVYDSTTKADSNATAQKVTMNKILAYCAGLYAESPIVWETSDSSRVTKTLSGITKPSEYIPSKEENFYREDMDTDKEIISIAVTNDYILLGTGKNRSTGGSSSQGNGAFFIKLDSTGKPETSVTDSEGKTSTVKATSFSDFPKDNSGAGQIVANYHVKAFLCATPEKNLLEGSTYLALDYIYTESTASTSINNRGLWSYYPARGNWNRE